MRDLRELNHCRIKLPGIPLGGATEGAFAIKSPTDGRSLRVVASAGYHGWDHVSVSLPNRCPNWPEMSRIAELFFQPDEVAMQLHVPKSDHINNHPYCLHWWRPCEGAIPRPPGELVGLPELTTEQVRKLTVAQANAIREEAERRLAR